MGAPHTSMWVRFCWGITQPIRFVVNEKDTLYVIIESALKSYAHEGTLPLLVFMKTALTALNPLEAIGSYGVRNFVLCKKQVCSSKAEPNTELISQKSNGGNGWKAWFNKSFGLKILSH
ncbi:hypothetical protein Ahy_A10g050586 [Arachis hypogaea]|uniref:DUF7054 domain-containing protein n=1 Tax=Arachis hypogaea TaxID=3818 RepID=A0A445B9V3_ARAHY|nr:hypothetical protein Ahy_A10g050586 [Arachis hypogaea]